MKHIATIISDFVKLAADDWFAKHSPEWQQEYLNKRKHSQKRLTVNNGVAALANRKYSGIKRSAGEVLNAVQTILNDVKITQASTFLKNIDLIQELMNGDVEIYSRQFRDQINIASNRAKEQYRECLHLKDTLGCRKALNAVRLLTDCYSSFPKIKQHYQPKINLNIHTRVNPNGDLTIQSSMYKNRDVLVNALASWKKATNNISNTNDFERLLSFSQPELETTQARPVDLARVEKVFD